MSSSSSASSASSTSSYASYDARERGVDEYRHTFMACELRKRNREVEIAVVRMRLESELNGPCEELGLGMRAFLPKIMR